jgi:hypothetical protein
VSSDGLTTIVQPAASDAAAFLAIMDEGKFHYLKKNIIYLKHVHQKYILKKYVTNLQVSKNHKHRLAVLQL